MKKQVHKASSRGNVDFGWLKSSHSFSFGNYYNPSRMNFGALRVLNDDLVAPGMGFGTHPHQNMEIISIPLSGELEHKDSMGNTSVIREGDIQVMSAGTGVQHSEYNKQADAEVAFLQIWIIPNQQNVTPRYQQVRLSELLVANELTQVVGPNSQYQGVWIHQDAYFSMGNFDAGITSHYQVRKKTNGIYLLVLEGKVSVADETLARRDALAISEVSSLNIEVLEESKLLLMEVPLYN